MAKQKNKKKKITVPFSNTNSRFNIPNLKSYDKEKPIFSFQKMKYQKDGCLSKCDKKERAEIIDTLLLLSQSTWIQIKKMDRRKKGFEKIPQSQIKIPLPKNITEEVYLLSFRFSKAGRMAGYRIQNTFHIVIVDPNHNLY